jgi:hypothetical protein
MKGRGELNEKYPGGVLKQAKKLQAEGHTVEPDRKGNPRRVKDWERKLVSI